MSLTFPFAVYFRNMHRPAYTECLPPTPRCRPRWHCGGTAWGGPLHSPASSCRASPSPQVGQLGGHSLGTCDHVLFLPLTWAVSACAIWLVPLTAVGSQRAFLLSGVALSLLRCWAFWVDTPERAPVVSVSESWWGSVRSEGRKGQLKEQRPFGLFPLSFIPRAMVADLPSARCNKSTGSRFFSISDMCLIFCRIVFFLPVSELQFYSNLLAPEGSTLWWFEKHYCDFSKQKFKSLVPVINVKYLFLKL